MLQIKNLYNVSSETDVEFEYSDFFLINKTNGMVTISRAHLSEQLNFGEPIHTSTKDGDLAKFRSLIRSSRCQGSSEEQNRKVLLSTYLWD